MAGQEKTNREKALEIYLAHDGEITPAEIAHQLGEKPATVRSWKKRDNWDKALQEKRCNVSGERCNATEGEPRKRGAPKGNQNALMNIGGGAPKGNQNAKGHGAPKGNENAVKTGEYKNFSRDLFEGEDLHRFDGMTVSPREQLEEEIRITSMRERYMIQIIKDIRAGLTEPEMAMVYKLKENKIPYPFVDPTTGETVMGEINQTKMTPIESHIRHNPMIHELLRVEEALTRVQALKQKQLKELREYETEELRLLQDERKLAQTDRRLDLMEYQIKGDPDDEDDDDSGDDLGW